MATIIQAMELAIPNCNVLVVTSLPIHIKFLKNIAKNNYNDVEIRKNGVKTAIEYSKEKQKDKFYKELMKTNMNIDGLGL